MGKDKKGAGAKAKKAKKASEQAESARRSKGPSAEPVVDAAAVIAAARAAAFTEESPDKAFAHFRAEAEALPAEDYPIFTGQALLMRANIKQALEALEPHLPAAVSRLRDASVREVLELPSLVMALDFAAGRVPTSKLSAGELEKMLSEGGPWRELLLSYLEVASHPLIALVPRERVAAIRAGTGRLDKAQDFVALAGLFAEFAGPLAGKHPFSPESIDRLSTLGGALVQQLKPGKAVTQTPKRTPEALLRDRFAVLVTARYDHLQVLATVALGKRKADELLPALRSSVAPSSHSEEAPVDGKGASPG